MQRGQKRLGTVIAVLSMLAVGGICGGSVLAAEVLRPGVYTIEKLLQAGLEQTAGGFNYKVVAETRTGGVELFQLDSVKMHYHPKENHFLYILKGASEGPDRERHARGWPRRPRSDPSG